MISLRRNRTVPLPGWARRNPYSGGRISDSSTAVWKIGFFESDRHTRLPKRNTVRISTRRRRRARRISRIIWRISERGRFPGRPRVWQPGTARRWRLPRPEGAGRIGYTSPPRGAISCASCWRRERFSVSYSDHGRRKVSRQPCRRRISLDRPSASFRDMARSGGGSARRDFGRIVRMTRGRPALRFSGGTAPGPLRARRGSHRP